MNENTSRTKLTLPSKIINFLSKDKLSVSIVFVRETRDGYVLSYMTPIDKSVEKIRDISISFINKKTKWKAVKYNEDLDNDEKTGIYRTMDINQVPAKKSILKKPVLVEQNLSKELIDSTVLIGFRFELPNVKPAMFLKKINKNYFVLKQGLYARVISGVVQLAKDEFFKLPSNFDLVTYGGDILIFNTLMFENFFGFYDIYKDKKETIFQHLRGKTDYEIDDLDGIGNEIDNTPRFLRKFLAIEEKEIYTKTLDDLKNILAVRPIAKVEIIENNLKFEDAQAFVDFYNDNYLSSYLTQVHYTSRSKIRE